MEETAPARAAGAGSRGTRVVVATSVMLSFISFWRAAAIVLADLGSSAFYVGGIAEQAVGRAAPWFILGVMLFSYAVRAVYICQVHAKRSERATHVGNGYRTGNRL